MYMSLHEQELCRQLRELPRRHNYRFELSADRELREILFRSLAGRDDFLSYFFPNGLPTDEEKPWSLRDAQGAVEGAEYTAAARGKPCGHIFNNGEATYRCKTCSADDTCVLCARCFDASDHEGHQVFVSVSPGNSGCCDCGDDEAWIRPVHCNIHSIDPERESKAAGKARQGSMLPDELVETIRTTIARTLDYLIDVFSCSPEQLRLLKTEESIRQDERNSRLTSRWYEGGDESEECDEFCLVLWNDEKHTVNDVRDQVARACKQKLAFGLAKAYEINDVGRSAIVYRTDLNDLLRMAKIIEEIKLTVTIRSARDTFREQMGGVLIEWIQDIAGCSVGEDNQILRRTVCEELLKPWRVGSEASNQGIGKNGLDDHEMEDKEAEMDGFFNGMLLQRRARIIRVQRQRTTDTNDDTTASDDDDDDEGGPAAETQDDMDIDEVGAQDNDGDVEMVATIVVKGTIWFGCARVKTTQVQALAQDCKTDFYFNTLSLLFPLIGGHVGVWWLDPLGAACLSLYIIYDWACTCFENVTRLTGEAANDRVERKMMYMAYRFSPLVEGFKSLKSYHAGDGVCVEIDVLMKEETPLRKCHDIAETLQYCLEGLNEVDRAFVTMDYTSQGPTGHAGS